MLHKNNI